MVLPAIFQFVCNRIFLFVQITCNACYTYDVPTESKLPLPVDLVFFYIHLLVIVSIVVVQISLVSIFWDIIFDLLKCVL